MSSRLGDILKKLGWDDGFQVPIANDENKALEEELAKLSLKKTKTKNNLDLVSGRVEALTDHFRYVSQENEQTQKLITAYRQQLENVENQYYVGKSDKETTHNGTKKFERKLKESEERNVAIKSVLEKNAQRAEELKAEMAWDANALKAWEETLKKRDVDIELIKKFSKEDERRYNELEAKRQHLQNDLASKKGRISKIASEANNYQLIIERSGKVIKQQITEREALIKQWKETVKMLQQRDNDILKAQERIVNLHELIEKEKEKLTEEYSFLKIEKGNNHDFELEIQNLNALNSRMRRDFNDLTQYLLLLNSELHSSKRHVASTTNHLQNERIKSKRLQQTFKEKEMLLDKYNEDIEKLEKKYREIKDSSMSASERIKKIENLIDNEERLCNNYLSDTEKLNGIIYRTDRLLKEQKRMGKFLELDINNATFNCSQLRKHIQSEKKNMEKIKEVVYDMEYRIDDIEKKLYKFTEDTKHNGGSDENDSVVRQLEETLAEHKDVQHVLQNQVDRLQEEMRRLTNLIATEKGLLEILQNKCENHLLVYEISKKQIAAAKQSTQEKQVEENLMRLRINEIEKEKKNEEKDIFSLEKLRLNLNQIMKERQCEINVMKTVTQAKKRCLEEDKGRLKADIALRKLKIEQIQKKYHIALTALGKDDEGQLISVTHFKIKNAQEKFILQQEGDELDQKIKTAEKEIVAMENTLKLVNLTNASFKNSLAPVKDEDEEVQEMNILQDQFREIHTTLKLQKNEQLANEQEIEELQGQLKELEKDSNIYKDTLEKLEDEINLVRRQELDKSEKLRRTECQLKKIMKNMGKVDTSKYDRDFEIRQLKDVNRNVTQRLFQMSELHSEILPLVNRYIIEYTIPLPEKRLTPSSSSSLYSFSSCASANNQNTERSTASSQGSASLNKVNLSLNF